MQEANATLDALLKLGQCVAVEPDKGCKRAVLNLACGTVVQTPGGSGFTLFGSGGAKTKLGADCLIIAVAPRLIEAGGQEAFKVLAGDDLRALRLTWEGQAKLLFGS